MDAQAIVRHIGSEKLHRLDAEDPGEFERTIGAYVDPDEDYESIRTEILELIGAENPPLTGDDLRSFIQGVKKESKQNTGGRMARITESRLREIIKEEISNIISENQSQHPYGAKIDELAKQFEKAGYEAGKSIREPLSQYQQGETQFDYDKEKSIRVVGLVKKVNNMPSLKEIEDLAADFYNKHAMPKDRYGEPDLQKMRTLGGVNKWFDGQRANLQMAYYRNLIKGAKESGFSFQAASSSSNKGTNEGQINNIVYGTLTKGY